MNGIFAAIFTITTSGILLSNFLVELDASPLEVGAYRTNVILLIQIWIVPRNKKASKQAEILSHLTTNKTTIFFSQPSETTFLLSDGREILMALPLFFFVFQTRLGHCGRIPRLRKAARLSLES